MKGRVEGWVYASLIFIFGVGAVVRSWVGMSREAADCGDECYGLGAVGGLVILGSALVLLAGVWWAWRVGTGRVDRAGGVILGLVVLALGVIGLLLAFLWHNGVLSRIELAVPSSLLVVLGLVMALRVGRFGVRRTGKRLPLQPSPVWLVAEPGVEATRFIIGDERACFLAGGTTVTEVRRTGSRVLVATPDGLEGWVDQDRLQPAPDAGDREGGGDG